MIEPDDRPPLARPLQAEATPALPSDPMLLAGLSGPMALGNVAIFLLAAAALTFAGDWVSLREGDRDWASAQRVSLVTTVIVGFVLVALVALGMRVHGLNMRSIGLSASRLPINLLLGIPAMVLGFAAVLVSGLMSMAIWPDVIERKLDNLDRIETMVPAMSTGSMVLLSAAVGFYEEVIFRGFLLTHIRRLSRSWIIGVVFTSALFALLHGVAQEPIVIVQIFPLAIVFSVFTVWRRSLVPVIVAHMLFDFIQLMTVTQFGDAIRQL